MGIWLQKSASWWPAKGPVETSRLLSGAVARRASELTRLCAHVMGETIDELPAAMPIVFGSCLGSVSLLFSLVDQMAEDEGGISPIRFSGSVHHAPMSSIGIAARHTGFVSAVAANDDLCAMVLIEALGVARQEGEVLVVVADEAWPAAFGLPSFEPYAAALLLRADEERSLSIELSDPSDQPLDGEQPEELAGNPSAGMERFLSWVALARPGDSCPIAESDNGGRWVARCR